MLPYLLHYLDCTMMLAFIFDTEVHLTRNLKTELYPGLTRRKQKLHELGLASSISGT